MNNKTGFSFSNNNKLNKFDYFILKRPAAQFYLSIKSKKFERVSSRIFAGKACEF